MNRMYMWKKETGRTPPNTRGLGGIQNGAGNRRHETKAPEIGLPGLISSPTRFEIAIKNAHGGLWEARTHKGGESQHSVDVGIRSRDEGPHSSKSLTREEITNTNRNHIQQESKW